VHSFTVGSKIIDENCVPIDPEIINAISSMVVADPEIASTIQSYGWPIKSSAPMFFYWLKNHWWKLSRCQSKNWQRWLSHFWFYYLPRLRIRSALSFPFYSTHPKRIWTCIETKCIHIYHEAFKQCTAKIHHVHSSKVLHNYHSKVVAKPLSIIIYFKFSIITSQFNNTIYSNSITHKSYIFILFHVILMMFNM